MSRWWSAVADKPMNRATRATRATHAATAVPATAISLLEAAAAGSLAQLTGDRPPGQLSYLFVDDWRRDFSLVTTLVFAAGGTAPLMVAKLARTADAHAQLRAERDNLERLASSARDELRRSVPRPLGYLEGDDMAVLTSSVVPGAIPSHRDLTDQGATRLVDAATAWLIELHRGTSTETRRFSQADLERHVLEPVARYRETFTPEARELGLLDATREAGRALLDTELPLPLYHGDFCPQNTLVDGDRLSVIDWDTPLAERLPGWDLFHFLACIADDGRTSDPLGPFRAAFLEPGRNRDLTAAAVNTYADALSIDATTLGTAFTLFWIDYALHHVAARAEREAAGGILQWWTLVQCDTTCRNLALLAERHSDLPFVGVAPS